MNTETESRYWKIENGHIVALMGMTFRNVVINEGDIGAAVDLNYIELPDPGYDLWIGAGTQFKTEVGHKVWIGKSSYIGNDCTLESGATIGECCHLANNVTVRSNSELDRLVIVGDNSSIGQNCSVNECTEIGSDSSIGDFSVIGKVAHIGNSVRINTTVGVGDYCYIGSGCRLHHNVVLHNRVYLGGDVCIKPTASVGKFTSIGSYSYVGAGVKVDDRLDIASCAKLIPSHFMQFHGVGTNGRNLIMYVNDRDEVVISVGCQRGIPFSDFKERVGKRYGTSQISADVYMSQMDVFKSAVRSIERAAGIGLVNKICKSLFGVKVEEDNV